MKKLIVYVMAVSICFAAGCKKNQQDNRVYLLKEQIIDDRAEHGPVDTALYNYDDQNRVIQIIDGVTPARVNIVFQYDNQNRLSVVKKYNTSGPFIIEFDFYYGPNGTGYYFYGPAHIADTASFIYNSKNQVTKIQTIHSGSQVFTYDGKGNIESSEGFLPDGSNGLYSATSYAYDDKKNPFSGTPSNNLYFMYVGYHDPSTHINNVLVKNADTYSYTYNAAGYPIKALVNTDQAIYPIYYNYIVK